MLSRTFFAKIFFRAIGLFGVIGGLYTFFTNPHIVNATNFVEKYTLLIFGVNWGLILFFLPELAQKGWCTLEYYKADERQRAKANFTIFVLGSPGFVAFFYLCYSAIKAEGINFRGLIMLILLATILSFHFLKSIYVLFLKNS